MKRTISKRVAPAILALGLAGSVVGVAAENAFAATSLTATGVIFAVRPVFHQLNVTVSKKTEVFRVTSKSTVTLNGKASTLDSLKAGESVTVTYTIAGKRWNATLIAAK